MYFFWKIPTSWSWIRQRLLMHGLPSPSAFASISFFPVSLFLAIPFGHLYIEQQAKESLKNTTLFCLVFSLEQATYGTTGFYMLIERLVRIGRYRLAPSPFWVLLSSAAFGVPGCAGQSGWSRGRRNACWWYSCVRAEMIFICKPEMLFKWCYFLHQWFTDGQRASWSIWDKVT